MGDVIATSVSSLVVYAGGMFSTSNSTQQTFLSSINGVAFANIGSGGIAGIPSSLNTSSISTFSFTGTTAFISSLTVNALFIGSNQGFVNMGDVIATSLSSLVIYTGSAFATSNQASITSTQQLNISSINGQTFGGPIISTVIGLGTAGYLSTIVFGSIVSTANLANLVSTANLANFVSTANLANHISTANLANFVSTANLANLVSTANLANHISTANLANLISTTYLSTQLGSTFAVLNVSSFSTFSFTGITGFMSTLTVNNLFIGSNQGFTTMGDVIGTSLSTILLYTGVEYATNIYASSLAVSSIQSYSNQVNILSAQQLYVSSIQATNIIGALTTANLANLVSTANLANLVSTANLANLVSTANLANLVSTANLANLVSTSYLATQLGSTVRGLGTVGYLSSINYSTVLLSSLTALNLTSVQGYISSLVVDSLQLGSNTAYIYMGDVIATSLSTVYVATGSLNTPRVSTQQLFVSSIAINCNAPVYALDINANFRVNSNSFLTGGATSYLSNSGLFSNAATATFASNVLHTGGLTSLMSNSGLFSNAATATFASNVTITANGVTTLLVSNSSSATNALIKCEMTGANFQVRQYGNGSNIAIIENTGGGGLLLNPLGATVGIGSSNIPAYALDVYGIARSAIPVSNISGTSFAFTSNSYGIYYYITNSGFSNIALFNTSAGATGTPGTAPPVGTGWYVTLRNNTGSYLSITVNGLLASTPASPFTIPPSNSVTIAYDAALTGGAGYVFF